MATNRWPKITVWVRDLEAAWKEEDARIRTEAARGEALRDLEFDIAAQRHAVWEHLTVPGRCRNGSWLSLIEGFFSKLARSVLRHIRVASKQELKDRLIAAIDYFNQDPVVHTWNCTLGKGPRYDSFHEIDRLDVTGALREGTREFFAAEPREACKPAPVRYVRPGLGRARGSRRHSVTLARERPPREPRCSARQGAPCRRSKPLAPARPATSMPP